MADVAITKLQANPTIPKFSPKIIILHVKIINEIIFPISTTPLFSDPRNRDWKINAIVDGIIAILIIWIASFASRYLGKNTSISFGGQGSNLVMGFDEKGSLLDIFNDKKSDNVLEIFKGGKKWANQLLI